MFPTTISGVKRTILALLTGGVLAVLWAKYRRAPDETPCEEIPGDSVVLAPAFLHLGERGGRILPGKANAQIAQKLQQCAERFSVVLTQKAVSDALPNPEELRDGTPVLQMHRHDPRVGVRTFAALRCALQRLAELPDRVVLLAQPKHLNRARLDLRALYDGAIVELHLGEALYQDDRLHRPLQWAAKNALAWLVDAFLALSMEVPLFSQIRVVLARFGVTPDCPEDVQLSPVVRPDGGGDIDDAPA